jgi:probable O-glycosylation ligase (exosortase A-associated)
MKHLVFMIIMTVVGTSGVLLFSPFYGVAVYYVFAVLRPQHLWEWSLPAGISWSLYVAVATILGAVATAGGFVPAFAKRTAGELVGSVRRTFTGAHLLVLLCGAWFTLTGFTAQNTDVSYPWTQEYVKVFVMFTAAAVIIRTLHHAWIMMCLAALSLGYIAYEINAIYLFQGFLSIYRRGYGGLDNNGAGLMLAMGVPLCIFIWEGTSKHWRWLFLGLVPLLLHAVLMSYSRGAMLALAVVVPLLLMRSRHRRLMFGVVALMAVLLPILAGPEIRARFTSIQEFESDESAGSRFVSWQAGWAIARENPILGVGVRNSSLITEQYGVREGNNRAIHSQYLQVAADSGIVGLGLYVIALVAVWRNVRRVGWAARARRTEDERYASALANGIEGSMGVFCVGAAFLSLEAFELPYLLLLLGAQLPLVFQPATAAVAAVAPPDPGLDAPRLPTVTSPVIPLLTARRRHWARQNGSL